MGFVLNNKTLDWPSLAADTTLLRYLRNSQQLTGTKEGCGSGDCGACTVIVGRPGPQGLSYSAVNACICPLGSLQDCLVYTVEALAKSATELHPAQAALVQCHGSQCGFCTPGFVMSLACLQLNAGAQLAQADKTQQRQAVLDAISGNLCRCTGYRPIVEAGIQVLSKPEQVASFVQEWVPGAPLASTNSAPSPEVSGINGYWQPDTETELQALLRRHPQAKLVAGGTDLMLAVTQQYQSFSQMIDLNRIASLQVFNVEPHQVTLGAALSYSRLERELAELSPEFVALLGRLGSRQIRNRGTLGGNIGNASPIADCPPYLLVLEVELELVNERGEARREKLTDFYLGYKQTSLRPGEYLARIIIPREALAQPLKLFKISKRYEDDISAVMGAFYWSRQSAEFRIALGGMAATPKRASATEAFLCHSLWCSGGQVDELILAQACELLRSEFAPMSDVRASAEYRMAMACNLLKKACYEMAAEAAGQAPAKRLFAHA